MTILEEIIERKKEEVRRRKKETPVGLLRDRQMYNKKRRSLASAVRSSQSGVIAEFKRCSPSIPGFSGASNLTRVVQEYQDNGAAGISILTDEPYFGGNLEDLEQAAAITGLPLLRKDFMIDAYQMEEARAYGADAVLLIAAALPAEKSYELTMEAKGLGLEVVLEVHTPEEAGLHINPFVDVVGVNNRDLRRFTTDISISVDMAVSLPKGMVRISESGITTPDQIRELQTAGYDGFLIGGSLLKADKPGDALRELSTAKSEKIKAD